SHFRKRSYREVYEECVREFVYDFRLIDQSLLLFVKCGQNCHDGSLSYSYYECPVRVLPYRVFLAGQIGVKLDTDEEAEAIDEWGDELRPEYEQYVNSLEAKHIVTPIRYDYQATA